MSNSIVNVFLLLPAFSKVLAKTFWAAVTAPFTSTSPTYSSHIFNAAVRAGLGTLSPKQIQSLAPPFLDNYKSHCQSNNLVANIISIPNTASKGFWLGNSQSAKYHMLYMHGGGYVIPAGPAHIAMLEKFIKWSNNNLAIFCVCYTLSPEAVYPVAISQCVEGLRYLLSLPNSAASTTTLAGDSAGGALVLAVLSHVSSHPHPTPEIVRPLSLDENLQGAIMVDPFISTARYPSVDLFANRDSFDKATADRWLGVYRGDGNIPNDHYITPAHAPASWWTGTKCGPIFATAGEEEILRDSIIDWAGKYREGMGCSEEAVRLVIGEHETHIYPVLHPYSVEELARSGEELQEVALKNHITKTFGA